MHVHIAILLSMTMELRAVVMFYSALPGAKTSSTCTELKQQWRRTWLMSARKRVFVFAIITSATADNSPNFSVEDHSVQTSSCEEIS